MMWPGYLKVLIEQTFTHHKLALRKKVNNIIPMDEENSMLQNPALTMPYRDDNPHDRAEILYGISPIGEDHYSINTSQYAKRAELPEGSAETIATQLVEGTKEPIRINNKGLGFLLNFEIRNGKGTPERRGASVIGEYDPQNPPFFAVYVKPDYSKFMGVEVPIDKNAGLKECAQNIIIMTMD